MSRRDWWSDEPPAPKRPPPAHGIKMRKAGTTWWGQRWIEALASVLGGDDGRLARGRTYARAGRTHDLVVERGRITALVTGSRPEPYEITIELAQIAAGEWARAIAAMAARAEFAADLLAGHMPQAIDEAFRAGGTSLFPAQRADLVTDCSCPDWGDPCKHVAATHYVLGEALDRDPFLLFELRGRSKAQVLDALRAARAAPTPARAGGRGRAVKNPESPTSTPSVSLRKLDPGDYEKPRAPMPALHFSFEAPGTHGAVMRQLGAPAGWQGERAPADALAAVVQAAAERARRIAMSDDEAPRDPPSKKRR